MPSSPVPRRPTSPPMPRPPTPTRRPASSCSGWPSTPRCRRSPGGSSFTSAITRAIRCGSPVRFTRCTTRRRTSTASTPCSTSWSGAPPVSRKRRHDLLGEQLDRAHRLVVRHPAEGEVADVIIDAGGGDLPGDIIAHHVRSAGDRVAVPLQRLPFGRQGGFERERHVVLVPQLAHVVAPGRIGAIGGL